MNVNAIKEQLPFYQEGLAKGLGQGREQGRQEGRQEGRQQGRQEGLQTAVSDLCELLEVELTSARQQHLAGLDLAGLESLRAHLKQHRAWPAG